MGSILFESPEWAGAEGGGCCWALSDSLAVLRLLLWGAGQGRGALGWVASRPRSCPRELRPGQGQAHGQDHFGARQPYNLGAFTSHL